MAQPNSSEQFKEHRAHPFEKVDSSASAVQGIGGERSFDLGGVDELHEPPSSCVGYGGGDSRYIEPHNMPSRGYWEARKSGDSDEGSRYGQDIRASDSSSTVEQRGGSAGYGTVNPNARPSEAGFGSSGPGGYPDEGDYNLGSSFDDASSRQSRTHSKWGTPDESSVDGSEVRNGVRHGVTPHGVASGTGVADGLGGSTPTSSDIKEHEYHRTEVAPSQQKDTPYSHMLTDSDGPSEGIRDRFQEEDGITGNTMGGTAVDQRKEAAEGADHSEGEGFLKRLMHKLPGHGNTHESTDNPSDIKPVGSDTLKLVEEEDDEQDGVVTKVKDKLLPNHDKHHDEIDPKLYD